MDNVAKAPPALVPLVCAMERPANRIGSAVTNHSRRLRRNYDAFGYFPTTQTHQPDQFDERQQRSEFIKRAMK